MESLSLCLSSSPPIPKPHKTIPKIPRNSLQIPVPLSTNNSHKNQISTFVNSLTSKPLLKPHVFLPILMGVLPSSSSFASEIDEQSIQVSDKINIESILVSIDDFLNKYPYFVFGVTFIWLIGIPLAEEYLKKFKFIYSLNAFKKLRDDSSAQLLDIRDEKSLNFLGSPNLRMFKKNVVQVCFNEDDEDGFLKKVMEKFENPTNTVLCIMDNFDGNSIKVAELLVKNGFKEAYAVKGGISGKSGWREIQQELLPPSVHVYPKKKDKRSQQQQQQQQHESNGAANQSDTQVQNATSEK